MSHPLDGFLASAPGPVLVLVDDTDPRSTDLAPVPDDGRVLPLSRPDPDGARGWRSVVLVTTDRVSLRRLASGLPRVGRVRVVAVWLHDARRLIAVRPRPEWPEATHVVARQTGEQGVLSVLRLAAPFAAHHLLAEVARQAVPDGSGTHGGLVVGYAGVPPVPGLDPRAPRLDEAAEAADPELVVPPDVVIAAQEARLPEHPVIDRAPLVVSDAGPTPVDERVVNPMGWLRSWERPVLALAEIDGLDPARGVREADLPVLRGLQGVRIQLGDVPTHTVAGLAMLGVPLVARGHDPRLDPRLATLITGEPDLDDPLAREEHSVAARRAALLAHSTLAWRRSLAERAGVRFAGLPAVSVLLATKRPEQLDFALRQFARQRGVDAELVLATHGFAADPGRVRAVLGDRPFVLLEQPAETRFGDVLAAAAQAAGADVLMKMDDDDWYSPHALLDLLLARRYSGADVVGMPSEFVYLEELGITTRRNHPTEVHRRFVAGGTLMLDRHLLDSVGGFRPVRRFVDAQLLAGVEAAGGRIYRTHGLGYVLRRTTGDGHTWQRDAQEFRRADMVDAEWPGFHGSADLAVDARDLPGGPDAA